MHCVVVVILLLTYAAPSIAGDCGHLDFIRNFRKYNEVTFSGYYFHPDHCFSVTIPKGVVGRESLQPSSHHGFGALLPNDRGMDYLLVQGDWGAILDEPQDIPGSLNQVVSLRLQMITESNAQVLKKDVTDTVLADVQAKHLVVLYKCNDTGMLFWEDNIIAIDNSGTIYEIVLYASPKTYETSRSIRDRIVRTWKLERKKCEEGFQKRLRESPNK